ncbi:hypothetical protein EDC04DRAFT_2958138 [Pisolithus marmoratus]|nr:hypothetical protein EDC04DRAFT_2958138 [Pisolithus marmoratus]
MLVAPPSSRTSVWLSKAKMYRLTGLSFLTSVDLCRPQITSLTARFLTRSIPALASCRKSRTCLHQVLPIYISLSSATTNKKSKQFVKYPRSQPYAHGPPPVRVKTTAFLYTFAYRDPVEVVTDSGEIVRRIPVCNQSSGVVRSQHNWSIETDSARMASILPGHVAPWATGFILHHRSFLLIHALFALANTSLDGFAVTFVSYFIDMVHCIADEWDVLVSGIRNGTIPDFEHIGHVRAYLQINMRADPQRADELQNIGPPPLLPRRNIRRGITAGEHILPFPTEQWTSPQLGEVDPQLRGHRDTSRHMEKYFKRGTSNRENSTSLLSTTHDGLWRYLIDDVIQVTGFDPRNGLPVFRYSRRKNLDLRLPHAIITEADLASVIHAISGEDIMKCRSSQRRHRYYRIVFAALSQNAYAGLGSNAKYARQKAFEALAATSEEHQIAFDMDELGLPTIRIVKPGTFADYRRWRGENMGFGVGQIKVPVVLSDPKAQEWMAERVMMEL